MSNRLLHRIVRLHNEDQERQAGGTAGWNPDDIPDPVNPDGPPDKELFVAYAMMFKRTREWAEAEYERQIKAGGNHARKKYGME